MNAHQFGEGFLAEALPQAVMAQVAPNDPLQLAFHGASNFSASAT